LKLNTLQLKLIVTILTFTIKHIFP